MILKFRDVKGAEDYYKVSTDGEVFSKDRVSIFKTKGVFCKRELMGRKLKPSKDKDGYLSVGICVNGKASTKKVHRIVAEAFLGNPFNYEQVNHKNGIKNDNRVDNLEWVNQSQNMIHAFKTGLSVPCDKSGDKNPNYKTGRNVKGDFRKKCELCGGDFIAKIFRIRFCSKQCSCKNNLKIKNKL